MAARRSIHAAVQEIGRAVFTTGEIAAIRGATVPATTQALRRMEEAGIIRRVSRGVWANPADPRFSVYALVPLLAGAHSAYVSFFSALRLHGMIEQIPRVVYVATTGSTRRRKTPLGAFSFHRLDPRFFSGFNWYDSAQSFLVAEREKALVDCLYLSSRKGNRFRHLPELELGKDFDVARAWDWSKQIKADEIRTYVSRRLFDLLGEQQRLGSDATSE